MLFIAARSQSMFLGQCAFTCKQAGEETRYGETRLPQFIEMLRAKLFLTTRNDGREAIARKSWKRFVFLAFFFARTASRKPLNSIPLQEINAMQHMLPITENETNSHRSKQRTSADKATRQNRSLTFDTLEKRNLMAVDMTWFSGSTLVVRSDNNATSVTVDQVGSSIRINDNWASRQWSFAASSVGRVEFQGGRGNDRFVNNVAQLPVTAFGGDGNDHLEGYNGIDQLIGGNGNDTLLGYGGDDRIWGGSGSDTIRGGAGSDFMDGQDGDDVLWGESGNDTIYGGAGADELFGGTGNDWLYGNSGNDRLFGDSGNDWLEGMDGHDSLWGGDGSDQVTGGNGADRFLIFGVDSVRDKAGNDTNVRFVNGSSSWTSDELRVVDQGFAKLVNRTDGKGILKDTITNNDLTFYKERSASTDLGYNREETTTTKTWDFYRFKWNRTTTTTRKIIIRDWNENDAQANARAMSTVIHEIGHNWDSAGEMSKYLVNGTSLWNSFLQISGWRTTPAAGYTLSTDGQWYYRSNATFAREYGRTNPKEDFATSWELYFQNNVNYFTGPIGSKLLAVDAFFTGLRHMA